MLYKVVLGLGSNAGNRFLNIKKAVNLLHFSKQIDILAISNVYETEPWGFKNQNNFLNCVIVILCRLTPALLLKKLKNIEKLAGRIKREKWKEREIDIDILFYGNKVYKSGALKIPHPQLHNRNFVLKPAAELIPGFVHPEFKKTISELIRNTGDTGKIKIYRHQLKK
jgi:2-amino-4-hydroxy-6-hydroxymethyldihydropteridine diphosphokinase